MILIRILIIFIVLFVCTEKASFSQSITNKIDNTIKEDFPDFSGTITLMDEYGKLNVQLNYGYTDTLLSEEITTQTLFSTASLSKLYTMIGILLCVDNGSLSLEDRLLDYITGFTDPRVKNVTIQHLLSHKSGWGHYWDNQDYINSIDSIESHKSFVEALKNVPLDFDPGTNYQYSNIGYILLGHILEQVTGLTFHEYIQKNLFEPTGMTASNYFQVKSNSVYAQRQTKESHTFISSGRGWADGGAYSTIEDLIHLSESLFYKKNLLSDTSLDLLFSEFNTQPLGIFEIQGGFPGVSTFFAHDSSIDHTLIVLSNQDPPIAENIAKVVLDIYSGEHPQELTLRGTIEDKVNGNEIPYANIGIFEKQIGTASTGEGKFSLKIPKEHSGDTLTFSAIGYERLEKAIHDLKRYDTLHIKLAPTNQELNEITIVSSRLKAVVKGTRILGPVSSGAYIGGGKPGACLMRLFRLPQPISYLNLIKVHVRNNRENKNFKLRLRIMNSVNGSPEEDLLVENIITESNIKEGWLEFHLKKPLQVSADVFVGVEWIEKPLNHMTARDAFPRISYSPGNSVSYARTTSLDRWSPIDIKPAIQVHLEF